MSGRASRGAAIADRPPVATFYDQRKATRGAELARSVHQQLNELADLVREGEADAELRVLADRVIDIVEPASAK